MRENVNILYRIVDSFFRHRRLFAIVVLTTTGAAGIGLRLQKKTYVESALTRIIPNDTSFVLGSVVDTRTLLNFSAAQQHVERFKILLQDDRPGAFLYTALKGAQLRKAININPIANDHRHASLRK